MRIIHVIDDLNEQAGGPAQACIEMAAAVAALGHHVSIYAFGASPATYRHLPTRSEFDLCYPQAKGRKVVLYFGRLHRKKRLDLVIRAVAAAGQRGHDIHLIVAGSDDGMGAERRRMVQQEGLSSLTTFTGLLVGEAKRLVFAGADVFILPSMTENFGIAVAEAAAAGVPLLISDQVNIAPVFARENAAVVVSTEAGPVSEGLDVILSDPERARAMARRAKGIVERQFSWTAVAAELVRMYRSAAHDFARGQGAVAVPLSSQLPTSEAVKVQDAVSC